MIQDGQNVLSNLAAGDSPTATGDTASGNVIDQQVSNGLFSEGGNAFLGDFLIVRVLTAFVSSGSGTIAAVLQDSADNVTFADVVVGNAIAAASAVAGSDLLNIRMPLTPKLRRYVRVAYRIATAAFQSGNAVAWLTPDEDAFDLSQRKATGTVSLPTGAADMSVANGVKGS